jgi:cytochrome oxidase Cu insertion factor (SCO1/SenC/PrrC family)
MHPDYTSAKPGKCPKCGMTLRPVADDEAEKSPAGDANAEKSSAGAGDATSGVPPRIPNVTVYDQDGRRRNFYDDLVKGKTVAINFIFTTCTTICPPMTATFHRVQQDLAVGHVNAELISVSVDPTTDTPERLRDFAAKFKAGPGWTFVTGDKAAIDSLLGALGAAVADKSDHTPLVLVGNDATGHWTRAYGLSPPATLVKVITEVSNRK